MIDDYQKANDEYRKQLDGANDQAVASEERDKRKKNAEAKLLELQESKGLQQFRRQTQTTLDEQKRRMRDQIVREIREQINNRARAGSYTLVLDSSAESKNEAPFILFAAGANDLTEEILSQLNLAAPAGFLDANSKDSKGRGDMKLNIPDPDKEKEKEKPARGSKRSSRSSAAATRATPWRKELQPLRGAAGPPRIFANARRCSARRAFRAGK